MTSKSSAPGPPARASLVAARRAHEARLADRADGDHLAHVAAPLDRSREGVEHGGEPRVGPADGTVHDDPDIVRERCPKRLLEQLGGAARLGGLARAPAQREDLLDM